jgi:hypothetical protein
MTADLLELKHHRSQVFISELLSFSLVGDGPVLAEDTAEIAVGYKYGTRPILTHQGYLFTKMGMAAEDYWFERGLAEPSFSFSPIHPTPTGAEVTVLKDTVSFLDSLSQFTLLLQLMVGWNPLLIPFSLGVKGGRREEERSAHNESTLNEIPACNFHRRPSINVKVSILSQ